MDPPPRRHAFHMSRLTQLTSRPRRNRKSTWCAGSTGPACPAALRAAAIHDGAGGRSPSSPCPGARGRPASLVDEAAGAVREGIGSVVLFQPLRSRKVPRPKSATIQTVWCSARSVRSRRWPELTVMTDVALDPYSTMGHDGSPKSAMSTPLLVCRRPSSQRRNHCRAVQAGSLTCCSRR